MAVIKSIEFNDEEELEYVTVRMSAEEAAFIAIFTGKKNGTDPEATMRGGGPASSHLHSAMAGGVFNRLYEDGVEEWLRNF